MAVEAVLGNAVSVLDDLGPVAVELDLMAPFTTLRRLFDKLGLHRADERRPNGAGVLVIGDKTAPWMGRTALSRALGADRDISKSGGFGGDDLLA
ncbi:hypothetical protein [Mesorhizobium sp. RIZ17]|uniref:hypothetical protein n=1 Tax=Mesorhizobium sp. RIZ17 TaxID=3132743 RepID=UPI003DA93F6B